MRKLTFALLAVLCASVVTRMPATAQWIPAGSYQDSCDTIQVNGDQLSARCQDVGGNWHYTTANMSECPSGTFANNNGALACGLGGYGIANSLPRGSWRASCRNASESNGMLYAECATTNGYWRSTSLAMNECPTGIADNSNGYLVCRGGSIAGYAPGGDRDDNRDRDDQRGGYGQGGWQDSSTALPPGSWSRSCRNWFVTNNVLNAQCRNGGGGWTNTSYNLGGNHNIPLANINGNLVPQNSGVYRHLEY